MIDVEMLRPTADEMLSGLSAGEAMKQKLLFKAAAVDALPSIAGEMLGNLEATPALRHRILVEADRKARVRTVSPAAPKKAARPAYVRFTPIVGMALVLTLMIGLGVNYGGLPTMAGQGPTIAQNEFTSGMAGDGVQSGSVPQYRSLFANGDSANPPLVGINGRFYRMLTIPVPQDVIGTQISEVAEFTDEPSLTTTVGTVSNIASAGTRIYAVDGLSSKTACIVEVDGVPRLFQRFGYASGTLLGNELFEDTLDVNGQVASLELSGVGVINDEQSANELIYMLSEFAAFHGNDVTDGGQALTIYLHNGLSLQMMVNGDVLGACGSWSCPEFFETFEMKLMEQ